MTRRSVAHRRRKLREDRHTRELLDERPDLGKLVDAYLWAYPTSPRRSRQSLLVATLVGIATIVVLRRKRS